MSNIISMKDIYYHLRPIIPRPLQIALRRALINLKKAKCKAIWPINPNTSKPPQWWNGWPNEADFALILTHDVETNIGQQNVKQLAELEMRYGVRSSFNFIPERYTCDISLQKWLRENGFEVGVHDLNHDGKLYTSISVFQERAKKINKYIREWGAEGFRSAAMHHNLDWIGLLDIVYDASTFDTDPFEPQPDPVSTIFPFIVTSNLTGKTFTELPYTLPQDFTLFVLMGEKTNDIWKRKSNWLIDNKGMVLLNTHPDYMFFEEKKPRCYSIELYEQLLDYLLCNKKKHSLMLPIECARYAQTQHNRIHQAVKR